MEYIFRSIKISFRTIDSKEFIPYLDKNNNKPYVGINNLIDRKKYKYLGLEADLNNKSTIGILFSNDDNKKNIKLSYSINF